MNSIFASVSLAILIGSAHALTPDGGKWHHPGSPFIVHQQTPTRHVGKGGTRLQSDPYGMPSYGRLHDIAYPLDEGFATVADFERPSQSFHHQHQHRRAGPGGPSAGPPQEPEIREFERQSYFRTKEDFGKAREEEMFFAGRPSYHRGGPGGYDHGMPGFFQQSPSDFYAGRPSTSFHNRPINPNNFY